MKKYRNQSKDQIQKLKEEEAFFLEKGKPSEEKLRSIFEDKQSKAQQGFLDTDRTL